MLTKKKYIGRECTFNSRLFDFCGFVSVCVVCCLICVICSLFVEISRETTVTLISKDSFDIPVSTLIHEGRD